MIMFLLKGARLPEGTVTLKHDYKTGRTYLYKKQQGKWVYVQGQSTDGRKDKGKKLSEDFNKVKIDPVISSALEKRGIKTSKDLENFVENNPRDESMKLFREVADRIRKTTNPAQMKYAMYRMASFGKIMTSIIRNKKPKKVRMTTTITSKTGNTYRKKKTAISGKSFPASAVRAGNKIMGSWSSVNSMPTSKDIKGMIESGNAKVLKGKINKSGTWRLPKKIRDNNHIIIPFRPDEKGIKVTLHQIKKNDKRDSVQAAVQITIPYAYAEKFLRSHVSSTRLLNDRIGQMKRSNGYKNALKTSAEKAEEKRKTA
jgi:hypothetical protein